MQKWRRSPDTNARGSRSYHAETKSNPACLHRHGTREKSGILNIKSPIFLTPPQELVELNKLTEKKWGHRPFLRIQKPLFLKAIHTKTRMPFGQHFDGEVPRNLNHVFLRPFEHGFNKKNWDVYVQKSKWRSHLKATAMDMNLKANSPMPRTFLFLAGEKSRFGSVFFFPNAFPLSIDKDGSPFPLFHGVCLHVFSSLSDERL